MSEKRYEVRYFGKYELGWTRSRYVEYLDDAFELYNKACRRAMKGKIKANHLQIVRKGDGMIFADCRVWYPPVTVEECRNSLCEERNCIYRIADVKAEIALHQEAINRLEKVL